MIRQTSIARTFYGWIAIAAIPGILWSAFEMYVLTLGGAQMLFFSVLHTAPVLIVIVLVGLLALVLWAFQSIVALVLADYAAKLTVPATVLIAFILTAIGHLSLLFWYERWSESALRIPVCLMGLVIIGKLIVNWARHLWGKDSVHEGADASCSIK